MSDTQYTIAPLVFVPTPLKVGPRTVQAKSVLGTFWVTERWDWTDRQAIGGWTWSLGSVDYDRSDDGIKYDTLEAAQLAAEQWYHDRLRPALKPVEVRT